MSLVLAACSPAQDERPRPTTIPADAPEIANDVYYLGTEIDPQTGEDIEGYAFVDRVADPSQEIEDEAAPTARLGCYSVLGFGGWTSAEGWGFDDTNSSGLAAADIQAILETGHDLWEAGAGTVDFFGSYDSSNSGNASSSSDGENNVEFGNAGGGGAVAVTYIWGRSTGMVSSRYISEWDQIYDDRYDWTIGDPVGSGAFDFLDVAAHELGHAAGLGHPRSTAACSNETMYAYVATGETKKRDLNTGDVQGILSIY
jgi:hypothetical protein